MIAAERLCKALWRPFRPRGRRTRQATALLLHNVPVGDTSTARASGYGQERVEERQRRLRANEERVYGKREAARRAEERVLMRQRPQGAV